jgi:hypothetical protein
MTPVLLALFGSLSLAAPGMDDDAALGLVEAPDEPIAARQMEDDALGLLSLKVKRGDKTLKHPGHIMVAGEQVVLSLKQGDHVHEVTVFVEKTEGGFKYEVVYAVNNSIVLEGQATGKAKQWVKVKSDSGNSWVELSLDPEKKRKDGVDMPGGNNPLDGL